MSDERNDYKGRKKFVKRTPRPPRPTERIIIGESDKFRRGNLLKNAETASPERVKQQGKHLLYIVGNKEVGLIEYLIVNAKLSE